MVDTSQSFKIVSPDSEGNLVLFSKDLQGIRENGLATDALIRKDVECEFHIQLVFMKIFSCLVDTPQEALDHHTFLVLVDEDEDHLGKTLKLIKFHDGIIKNAHVFIRDSVSTHSLKNLRHLESAVYNNLLNSET